MPISFDNQTRGLLVLYRSPECLGYAEIEQTWKYKSTQCAISCHPYRSIKNKFDPVIKMVKVNPGSLFEKKPQGMGIQPLGTSSGSILKLLLFPLFCTSSRKIPFASLFYIIFCFISYMYIKPQGKKSKRKGLIILITGCMFQKNSSAL